MANLSATSVLRPFWATRSFSHLGQAPQTQPVQRPSCLLIPFGEWALVTWSAPLGAQSFFLPCPLWPMDYQILLSWCELLTNPFLLPISTGFLVFPFLICVLEEKLFLCSLRFWIGGLQIKGTEDRWAREKHLITYYFITVHKIFGW